MGSLFTRAVWTHARDSGFTFTTAFTKCQWRGASGGNNCHTFVTDSDGRVYDQLQLRQHSLFVSETAPLRSFRPQMGW